jgi:hypothetical protein
MRDPGIVTEQAAQASFVLGHQQTDLEGQLHLRRARFRYQ